MQYQNARNRNIIYRIDDFLRVCNWVIDVEIDIQRKIRQRCHIKASWNDSEKELLAWDLLHTSPNGKHRYEDACNLAGLVKTFQECIV